MAGLSKNIILFSVQRGAGEGEQPHRSQLTHCSVIRYVTGEWIPLSAGDSA